MRESPPQFENLIMARVYVRSIVHSTMILFVRKGAVKISSVACGLSLVKIDYYKLSEKFYKQDK